MINKKWFKVKQRVELQITDDNRMLRLSTHIEKVDEAGFIVAAPFYHGQLYPFLSNENITLTAIVEGIGVVSCVVIINKRLKNGDIVLLVLTRITDVIRMQRRKHYRLDILLDTEIDIPSRPKRKTIVAVIKDISAGGARCITREKMFVDEGAFLSLNLNGKAIEIPSFVLDSINMSSQKFRFETRFKFKEMHSEEERVIVAYIFDEQRKRRRRR